MTLEPAETAMCRRRSRAVAVPRGNPGPAAAAGGGNVGKVSPGVIGVGAHADGRLECRRDSAACSPDLIQPLNDRFLPRPGASVRGSRPRLRDEISELTKDFGAMDAAESVINRSRQKNRPINRQRDRLGEEAFEGSVRSSRFGQVAAAGRRLKRRDLGGPRTARAWSGPGPMIAPIPG